ncbi:MAG TPA: SDR family NAD(P)-dependent oxidoreductase [Mycobacteriales bacterium]|jgi:NAD(P)-dependent dehydrogenase (short-subunit alcohol dehydrogenase family)|nr:SDR family NAD(P)-dependent oxidoreductase [Mycobacteriales bacterium]
MATICVTGSTDGIGRATARLLLEQGHRVLVHARSEARGRPVVEELARVGTADVRLVIGDLASLASVRELAAQLREAGPLDALAHNAGVWVRGDTPAVTVDGFETTFAVNVLAPHLLTALLADTLQGRLVWLGSGMVGSGRPKPTALGGTREPRQAYADSKACDVALAQAWGRRLPGVASAALDPGWVPTKLASSGAPGDVADAAASLAFCCTEADLGSAPYWKGSSATPMPGRLRDAGLQDAIALACDRLAGLLPAADST